MAYHNDELLSDVSLKSGQIDLSKGLDYILAGNSILTFVNTEKNTHVTFKIKQSKRKGSEHKFYVSALNGPDNTSHYKFIGTIYKGKTPTFYYSKEYAKIDEDSTSVKAFKHIFAHLVKGHAFSNLEIWHSSHCCRCGRTLTVKSSIMAGLGPHCAEMFNQ